MFPRNLHLLACDDAYFVLSVLFDFLYGYFITAESNFSIGIYRIDNRAFGIFQINKCIKLRLMLNVVIELIPIMDENAS